MKSHLRTAAVLFSLAGQIYGASQPAGLPSRAQYGEFHFPLKCTIADLLHETFDGLITATAPLIAGPGQQIYLTEATAQLTVPSSIIFDLFPLLGIKQAQAIVHTTLTTSNASPATVQVFPNGQTVNDIAIPFGKDIVVKVPSQSGATIPAIGPITLSSTNNTLSTISLGAFDIKLNLQTASGTTVVPNVPVTCGVQTPAVELATINVQGADGQAPLKVNSGGAGSFPAIPQSSELGSFRFPYTCDVGSLGGFAFDLSVGGAVQSALTPGEQFYLDDVTAYINLPALVVQFAPVLYPGTVAFRTTLSSVYLTAKNAAPATVNALASPVTVTSPIANDAASIPLPPQGSLKVGPFTAATTTGQSVVLGVGSTKGSTQLLNKAGKVLATYSVDCPAANVDLISLPIAAAA